MNISVVIPVYISNESQIEMTAKCISLAKKNTKLPFELVIVETGTDYFIDQADLFLFELNKTNATKSINRGFKICSGDYIVLLTNDVYLENDWLSCLVDCFKIKDCGLSTLATTQLAHVKHNCIDEGIWFSVAMMPRSMAEFDENYVNSWDDSDIIMRTYLQGKKMYRNYNCLVKHLVGKTQYSKSDHKSNFLKNESYFKEKYKDYSDTRIYNILTKGILV